MATALEHTLAKKEFHNWIKGAIAVHFAKDGLTEFVKKEIEDFQKELLHSIVSRKGIPLGTTCNFCTTANVLKCPTQVFCGKKRPCKLHDSTIQSKMPDQQCPTGICNAIKDAILREHRTNEPAWKNTDCKRWCSDVFDIAACYIPTDECFGKRTIADTDFIGIMSVIINNKRFQNKMTAMLSTTNNTCSKAVQIVNELIVHSPSYELSDVQLANCIEALVEVLQDSKCLQQDHNAQTAVGKLNQLKDNKFVISAEDVTQVLDISTRGSDKKQQQDILHVILNQFETAQRASVAVLESIIAAKDAALTEIRTAVSKTDEDLYKEFKDELCSFYNENESMIPASPLVEEHAVPLLDLYVQPPMSALVNPNVFGKGNNPDEKTSITSYKDLFLKDNKFHYRNIYIEAKAGMGKTSFTQKLAMTWCQAHKPDESLANKFRQKDVDTLEHFDLLFLLHMRDFQGGDICLLEDLVFKFVSQNLPGDERFSKQYITHLLRKRKCLVVFDGLDEWTHPTGTCTGKPGIPHNNYRENCTVLTTTRPWKMATLILKPTLIDRHLEISELDLETSAELKSNVIYLLSNRKGGDKPDIADFDQKVSLVKSLCLIPYILLQLLCIWFDKLCIGKSKCEMYCNFTELTLRWGLKKLPTSGAQNPEPGVDVPIHMSNNPLCKLYFGLLLKLGELAFLMSFRDIKESSLVVDATEVSRYLTDQDIAFCLKVGLLSQTRDSSKISEKRIKIFFQHKSIQEYFAALYITSAWENVAVKSTILKVCSSLSDILEMSDLLVFVCGINAEVYARINEEFQKVVENDNVTRSYRICIEYQYFHDRRIIRAYQSMQLDCFQECLRNGNDNCSILLQDIQLDEDNLSENVLTALKTIINFNKGNVKSLYLYNLAVLDIMQDDPVDEKIKSFMQTLDPGAFSSLETLRTKCNEEPEFLTKILTDQAHTLKCLELFGTYTQTDITRVTITPLTGLTSLLSLSLRYLTMSHRSIELFCAYISKVKGMRQLYLTAIDCSDHLYDDSCVVLDLSALDNLRMLILRTVSFSELYINPTCLENFYYRSSKWMTAGAMSSVFKDLRGAPVLSSLELVNIESSLEMTQTIPTLTQIEFLKLADIDIDRGSLSLSPEMTKLERLELENVTMTGSAWKALFLSFASLPKIINVKLKDISMNVLKWKELFVKVNSLSQPVTIELDQCKGPSTQEWNAIVDESRLVSTLSVEESLYDHTDVFASGTLKKKGLE